MVHLVLFPVLVWWWSDWWTWWMDRWKKERDRDRFMHANTPWQTSGKKCTHTHTFLFIRYLVCLVPAVLIPHSDLGSVIKQRLAAGRVAPCQRGVVQWRQASTVFIVQRRSQRQQSLTHTHTHTLSIWRVRVCVCVLCIFVCMTSISSDTDTETLNISWYDRHPNKKNVRNYTSKCFVHKKQTFKLKHFTVTQKTTYTVNIINIYIMYEV